MVEEKTAKNSPKKMKTTRKTTIFGTSYDTVFFVLCFIVYLAVLSNLVTAQELNISTAATAKRQDIEEDSDVDIADIGRQWENIFETAERNYGEPILTNGATREILMSEQEPLTPKEPDVEVSAQNKEDQQESESASEASATEAASEAPVTESATAEPETTTTMAPDPRKMVKLDIIYEDPQVLPWVEAAVEYAQQTVGDDIKVMIVGKLHARRTHDAIGLVTRLCKHIDEMNMQVSTKIDLILDFTRIGIASEAVKIITRTLKIPTISVSFGLKEDVREWMNLDEKQSRYLVRILPPSGIISYAVRSITEMQDMKTASIFIGGDMEITYEPKVALADVPVRHHFVPMDTLKNIGRQVKTEIRKGFQNFFFITSPTNISSIIDVIHTIPEPHNYTWFVITMEPDANIVCSACSNDIKIVYLRPPATQKGQKVKEFLHKKNLHNPDILDNVYYFDLVVDSVLSVVKQKTSGEWPEQELGRIPCSNYDLRANYADVSADVLKFFQAGKDLLGSYKITENGRHHANFELEMLELKSQSGGLSMNKIGTWKAAFGGKELMSGGAQALEKYKPRIVYHVGTVIHPPWVMKKANCNVTALRAAGNEFANCYEGYHIDVLNALAKELGFNYTIAPYKTFGYLSSTTVDDWDGVMKDIMNHKVDLAIGTLQYMPERLKVAELTRTYGPMVGFSFIIPKTMLYESATFKFLTILEPQVWWCIIGAYAFTSVLMFVFDKYGPTSAQNSKEPLEEDEDPPRVFDFKECFWFCITSMTAQGGGEAPRGLSGRLVAATWWLFSFIIMASYTANMAAYLTVPGLTKPIMSFDELINQQAVQFAPVDRSAAWHYFDRMANTEQVFYERWRDMSLDDSLSEYNRSLMAVWTYPVSDKFTKFWQSMVDNKPPQNVDEAVRRLRVGLGRTGGQKFAFIAETTDLVYVMMQNCGFRMVGDSFGHRAYAMALQKGSPMLGAFNRAIDKLEKHRVMDAAYDRWWRHNPLDNKRCHLEKRGHEHEDTTQAIPIENLTGVWVAGGVGLALGLVVIFLEWAASTTRIWFENKDIKGAVKKILRRKKHA